jgi:hypothetical protein
MGPSRTSTARRLQDQGEAILRLARSNKGRSVAVFGSVAHGEDDADSDVDPLVEFEPSSSLLDLIALEEALQHLLGTTVDVTSVAALLERDVDLRRDAVPLRRAPTCRGTVPGDHR